MSERLSKLLTLVFGISEDIRYCALYHHGELVFRQREKLPDASSSDSDKYEELIVNPVLLKAAEQRGDIDCGGMRYLIVRYGNFYQFVTGLEGGHLSVCVALEGDPIGLAESILDTARTIEQKLSQDQKG